MSRLLLLLTLLSIAACSNKDEATVPAEDAPAADAPAAAAPAPTAPNPAEPESVPAVDVPEEELIQMVGYITAQRGGVPGLQLNAEEIAATAEGFREGLSGTLDLEDYEPVVVQSAYGQAQARDMAIRNGAEIIPGIDAESLRLLGAGLVAASGLGQLGFGADEAATIATGFAAGAANAEPDPDMLAKMPAFQTYMENRMAVARAAAAAEAEVAAVENIAAGKAFLENLAATDADVQVTESGLYYKVIEPGTGEKPSMMDSVLVHYKGTLIDGTKFDSSHDRGAPATFGLSQVVKGFGEGLTKVGVGGKIILYMPSNLGYGNSPRPGGKIKPGDALIFECELLEINPG